ncbi:MAG: Txe/YoeB family addiction module toxin [Bacteroides sp.]|nr:Txe/YoeB family addiction module toxin [Bacteroides sp.]
MYKITYTLDAEEDLRKLKKNDPASFKKAVTLLNELIHHPATGTGHPHRLVGNRSGQWSRSISKKHRLVYQIQEQEVLVLVPCRLRSL